MSGQSLMGGIQGLRPDGRLIAMGEDAEPLSVSLMDLIMKRIRVIGSQQNGPNISTKPLISWRKGESKRSSRLTGSRQGL